MNNTPELPEQLDDLYKCTLEALRNNGVFFNDTGDVIVFAGLRGYNLSRLRPALAQAVRLAISPDIM